MITGCSFGESNLINANVLFVNADSLGDVYNHACYENACFSHLRCSWSTLYAFGLASVLSSAQTLVIASNTRSKTVAKSAALSNEREQRFYLLSKPNRG